MTEQIVPVGGQHPDDLAQNAINAQNPALNSLRAVIDDLMEQGECINFRRGTEWAREWDAAWSAWFTALHDAGDHRTCWPHACAVAAAREVSPRR